MNPTQNQSAKASKKRRAVVLVAVLVVITLLSLAGYEYAEMMNAEYNVSEMAHRQAQARAFADSGIHYAAAMLSSPDNFYNVLGGNPWNNPSMFQGVPVQGDNGLQGYFSLIAPSDPINGSATDLNYGVMDEGGKINLNTLMKLDNTGQQLHDVLMVLPNMTDDIAWSIAAWMGAPLGPQNGGAGNDYYGALSPSYRVKNAPLDSLDELLLIRGVTRDLLYGQDFNRNGAQDSNETAFDRGWSAFLTVHSREQNYDPSGNAYIFLGNTDLGQLQDALVKANIDEDVVKFIIMYRQYGPASSSGGSQSLGSTIASLLGGGSGSGGGSGNSGTQSVQGDLSSYQVSLNKSGGKQIKSIFSLVGASVAIPGTDKKGNKINTVYASPLGDPSRQRDLLPALFAAATLTDPSQQAELPARVNINTAPREVLTSLTFADTDVEKILALRPPLGSADAQSEVFQTPTWLVTEAQIDPTILAAIEPIITTRTQVFRVQSVGYFDGNTGPAIRLEAVIDTNCGRPRIIAWRNLSELGKGWNGPPP
jgi:type II secretory pathway component PulK